MKVKRVLLWIVAIFFLLSALVYMPSLASVLSGIAAVLVIPVPALQDAIKKYIGGGLKTVIVIVLTVVIAFAAPETEADNSEGKGTAEETTIASTQALSIPEETEKVETVATENTETETIPIEEEAAPIETQPAPTETTPIETQPASTETTPIETQPAPTETTPIETQPAPTETTPIETQPAPTETTPAETQPVPIETTPAETEQMVWITATGKKYHSIPNCGSTKSATCVPISQAAGLSACENCY